MYKDEIKQTVVKLLGLQFSSWKKLLLIPVPEIISGMVLSVGRQHPLNIFDHPVSQTAESARCIVYNVLQSHSQYVE